ncbi:MAG: hypothetical protein EBX52_12150 [Proteobacteria bacterium]|nr:hypothetical protein [Pseudomonadota bacterium]
MRFSGCFRGWFRVWFLVLAAANARAGSVESTFGVLTEEEPGIRFYGAPVIGVQGWSGIPGYEGVPGACVGGEAGVLVSDRLLFDLIFTRGSETWVPLDFNRSSAGWEWQENRLGVGARLFVFGRDSSIRPYLGGGFGWSRGSIGLAVPVFQPQEGSLEELTFDRFSGFGELGAEMALGGGFVALVRFDLGGTLLSGGPRMPGGTRVGSASSSLGVGNSVSRSTTYLLGAGVGIYF